MAEGAHASDAGALHPVVLQKYTSKTGNGAETSTGKPTDVFTEEELKYARTIVPAATPAHGDAELFPKKPICASVLATPGPHVTEADPQKRVPGTLVSVGAPPPAPDV